MRDLPSITPRIVTPDVVMRPQSFTIGPIPFVGPMAMVLSLREDTGARATTFIAAECLHPLIVTDEDGDSLDLSQVDPELFCKVVVRGWPDEWPKDGQGWAIVSAMTSALLSGLSWDVVRQHTERAAALSTADLN